MIGFSGLVCLLAYGVGCAQPNICEGFGNLVWLDPYREPNTLNLARRKTRAIAKAPDPPKFVVIRFLSDVLVYNSIAQIRDEAVRFSPFGSHDIAGMTLLRPSGQRSAAWPEYGRLFTLLEVLIGHGAPSGGITGKNHRHRRC